MGASAWSDDHYHSRATHRAATNTPAFAYSAATASKPVDQRKAHASLDPKGVKMRESRDSADHPESRAIAVLFDVTGSMGQVPVTLQKNLPKLMALLLRKNYIAHPQIMCGAIGDANSDAVPLQVGQFESGIEIENDLTNIYLEGNGGGQKHETYELAMYFLAKHTSMDCWEKRQQRGYLFIIGDEMPYPFVSRNQIASIIGDTVEADVPLEQIVKELENTFEVFHILPNLTSYYDDPEVRGAWSKMLGERALRLDDPVGVCELIASTIGLCEGVGIDQLSGDMQDAGTGMATVGAVRNALATVSARRGSGLSVAIPDSGAASGLAQV